MDSHIYDTASAMWIRFTPEGGVDFTSDRTRATVIDAAQLDSHIRNYELDYLRNTLVAQPCRARGEPA